MNHSATVSTILALGVLAIAGCNVFSPDAGASQTEGQMDILPVQAKTTAIQPTAPIQMVEPISEPEAAFVEVGCDGDIQMVEPISKPEADDDDEPDDIDELQVDRVPVQTSVTTRNGWTEITYSDGSMHRYSEHSVTNSDGIIRRSTHYEKISPGGAVERYRLEETISPGGAVSGHYVEDSLDF